MKLRLALWAALAFAITIAASPSRVQAAGGTTTFDSPADGAALHCTARITASITANNGYDAVAASVKTTNTVNGQINTYNMTRVNNTNQFEYNWDTFRVVRLSLNSSMISCSSTTGIPSEPAMELIHCL